MSQVRKWCTHILMFTASANTALAKDQSYGHKSTVQEAEEHWIPSQMPVKKKSSLPLL